jgi:hypothetical protein
MNDKSKSSRVEQEIDRSLKRAYDEVANQELPSKLTDLLAQLRAQDGTARWEDSDNDG